VVRLAIVASHPIQYHAPVYRALARRIGVHVFYAHRATPADQARAGFDVPFDWDVPLLDGYDHTWLENRARRPGIHHFFGCNTPGLRRLLPEGGFDGLLVSGWNKLSYWQAARAARKVGMPVLVRGDSLLAGPRAWWKRAAKRVAYRPMLARFDVFLSPGIRHREYLVSYGVPEERIFFVPHCVDNEFFTERVGAASMDGGGVRAGLSVPAGKVVFLLVGKLLPIKRPLDFLQALDILRRMGTDAWGLVVGDGPMRPQLEAHIRDHATPCTLAGFMNQSAIATAYAAGDVLVVSSESETWGLVVNEAMAAGRPAIVSDGCGCAPDLIVPGKTGLVYPMGRPEGLAGAMARMVEDPDARKSMGRNARERIGGYSIDAACDGVIRGLESVKAGCGRR